MNVALVVRVGNVTLGAGTNSERLEQQTINRAAQRRKNAIALGETAAAANAAVKAYFVSMGGKGDIKRAITDGAGAAGAAAVEACVEAKEAARPPSPAHPRTRWCGRCASVTCIIPPPPHTSGCERYRCRV